MRLPLNTAVALVVALAIPLLGGFLVGRTTADAVSSAWYARLPKPRWMPPGPAFGIVWTALYIAMGVASWLVFRRPPSPARTLALTLYGVQLLVNFAWPLVFFGARDVRGGMAVLAVLSVLLGATISAFWRVSTTAAWWMVPYGGWVAFAAALNAAILSML